MDTKTTLSINEDGVYIDDKRIGRCTRAGITNLSLTDGITITLDVTIDILDAWRKSRKEARKGE